MGNEHRATKKRIERKRQNVLRIFLVVCFFCHIDGVIGQKSGVILMKGFSQYLFSLGEHWPPSS